MWGLCDLLHSGDNTGAHWKDKNLRAEKSLNVTALESSLHFSSWEIYLGCKMATVF